MKTIIITLACVACLTISGFGQQQPAAAILNDVRLSAEAKLEKATGELNQLRDEIANEKQPLAQELTSLEVKLTQLRRDHDNVARKADSGNLEIANIKTEMKLREDELAYVGNLLDEYARGFEPKVNVCELQYCGKALDAAKQAPANNTLSMVEKFTQQVAFIEVSMRRLFEAGDGIRFSGIGVDMQGVLAEGQFLVIGPVALFCSKSGDVSGLVVPQPGTGNPLIRPLEGPMQQGIAPLVQSGEGNLPLDPSRGGALKALVQKFNLFHVFKKGGPIMWPLLIASILALGTVLERALFLLTEKLRRNSKAMDRFFSGVGKGDTEQAIQMARKCKFFVVRAMGYALEHREESLASALLYAQARELKRFQRGIPILDTVITLAPLLGLLGTVTGMMGSFSLIGGELSAPGAITGGIAEALIATAFGLGIAITSLLPFNFLNARVEGARHELEAAATQLELLVLPSITARTSPSGLESSAQLKGRKTADADGELLSQPQALPLGAGQYATEEE